jgi:hypothetical protein
MSPSPLPLLASTRCSITGQDTPALDNAFDLIEGHPSLAERIRILLFRG